VNGESVWISKKAVMVNLEHSFGGKGKYIPVAMKYHAMKAYWGCGFLAARILKLRHLHSLYALPPVPFGGWVGPRGGLDVVEKRKNRSP